jgi:hypothetical protein
MTRLSALRRAVERAATYGDCTGAERDRLSAAARRLRAMEQMRELTVRDFIAMAWKEPDDYGRQYILSH